MAKKGWVWYAILGVFYLGIAWIGYSFYTNVEEIRLLKVDENIEGEFEGNDWVTWVDTEQGVIAEKVHPLPFTKSTDKARIEVGDRLREIRETEVIEVRKADVVDKITRSTRPGHIFILEVERTDPLSLTVEDIYPYVINGFRLMFSFNEYAPYWYVFSWILGIGAFVSLIMLAILIPIVKSNWRDSLTLLGIVITAFFFFFLQLMRHLYLVIESDLQDVGFEKVFILIYIFLLFSYILYYFHFKSDSPTILLNIPSLLLGGFILFTSYQIIYQEKQLKYFHDTLEDFAALFFLIHLIGGICLFAASNWSTQSIRRFFGLVIVAVISAVGVAYYMDFGDERWLHREHAFFIYNMVLFFPLINATFLQLQFGKVSLVVTQTIQYLVAIILSILLYLLVIQLFDYIRPAIQYRRVLEFVTFVLLALVLRLVYLANENKFNRYFVSSKQQDLTRFKSFIAQIPQYTSSRILRKDLVEQLMDFFNAETVHLWWKGDVPDSVAEQRHHEKQESIYRQLTQHQTVWSKTKEISPFRLTNDLEKLVLKSAYNLICPITVDKDNYALLMLGKKRRGVYNLLDLELISNLIQQTQLTLNVLQLVSREKELIQQTYEANLTALRSQINPHFLFNTLNSIGELVHESADLAESAIEKLAFIFRYTLRMSSHNFVTLADEISLISTYLDLEKIRFGERLDIHIEIEPGVKDIQLPAFILSTLVENCIKHGIAKILHKGQVSVEAFREEDFLICEVVDNGPGIDLNRIYKSHGLSNSIARLENIYEMKNLLYFENTGEGTYVRLKIPVVNLPQLS